METVGELVPPIRVLLGPGPSNAHPRVLKALSTPLVGHLDPEFIRLMEETKELLRFVFQTKNALSFHFWYRQCWHGSVPRQPARTRR